MVIVVVVMGDPSQEGGSQPKKGGPDHVTGVLLSRDGIRGRSAFKLSQRMPVMLPRSSQFSQAFQPVSTADSFIINSRSLFFRRPPPMCHPTDRLIVCAPRNQPWTASRSCVPPKSAACSDVCCYAYSIRTRVVEQLENQRFGPKS